MEDSQSMNRKEQTDRHIEWRPAFTSSKTPSRAGVEGVSEWVWDDLQTVLAVAGRRRVGGKAVRVTRINIQWDSLDNEELFILILPQSPPCFSRFLFLFFSFLQSRLVLASFNDNSEFEVF